MRQLPNMAYTSSFSFSPLSAFTSRSFCEYGLLSGGRAKRRGSRSTLGTVVIVVSTIERTRFGIGLPSTVRFAPCVFAIIQGERHQAMRVPSHLLFFFLSSLSLTFQDARSFLLPFLLRHFGNFLSFLQMIVILLCLL